jgi:hypothetical protein
MGTSTLVTDPVVASFSPDGSLSALMNSSSDTITGASGWSPTRIRHCASRSACHRVTYGASTHPVSPERTCALNGLRTGKHAPRSVRTLAWSLANGSGAEPIDLDAAIADVDAFRIVDLHVVLARAGTCLVYKVHQGLGGGHEIGVIGRACLG